MTATRKQPQKFDWPGAGSLLDAIPDGWRTTGQVAPLVGRDKDTIRKWRKDGTYSPSGYIERGKLTIWLYSDEDIDAMCEIAGNKKPGRPPHPAEEEEA